MNSNHTVAGIFDGTLNTASCSVTINGSGTMTISSGQQGFAAASSASVTINVPMTGSGEVIFEGKSGSSGQFYFNAANSFTGGMQFGFSSTSPFAGTVYFNNNSSFGSGTIAMNSHGTGSTIAAEGTSAYNVANPFTLVSGTLGLIGTTGGVTFSGAWTTPSSGTCTLALNGAANTTVNISGQITGSLGFTKSGSGILILSGNNNGYGGTTAVSGGPLLLANTANSSTGTSAITVSPGATLGGSGIASGTVNNSGILMPTNLSGGSATLTTGGQTWQAGSAYQWSVNNPAGTAGGSSGWDEIVINGSLSDVATSGNPFTIYLTTLTAAGLQGNLSSFNSAQDYSWQILHSTSSPISGFATNAIALNTSGFANTLGVATAFSVTTNNTATGGDLFVNYVHIPSLTVSNVLAQQGSNAVLNAVNNIPNSSPATASYSWASNGVPLSDGGRVSGSQTSTLTIANAQPTDDATYTVTAVNPAGQGSATATLLVGTGTVVGWGPISPITYGVALTTNQLDATANTPGTFNYTPGLGTVLNSGNNTLICVFTPSNQIQYQTVTNTNSVLVNLAPLSVTANNFSRPYNTTNPVFTGTIVGIQNGDNITANYSCSATTSSPIGAYPIVPTLVDPNNRLTNYSVTTNNGALDIGSIITWAAPPGITYGTALGASQLDATANVPGSFVYTPAAGTQFNIGTYSLSVVFTPSNNQYNTATDSVNLAVSPAPLMVTASNFTRAAETANPVFTGSIVGLENGDNITANYNCSATPSSPPGQYSIVPTLVDTNQRATNYSLTISNGTLTVTNPPAGLAVTAPNIIPLPVTLQTRAGAFVLCPSQTNAATAQAAMQILYDSSSQQTAQYLESALFKSTGYQFPMAVSAGTNAVKGAILITVSNAIQTLGAEGYELTVAPDSVLIRAPQQGGAFYGAQSLLQLLPPQIYSPTIVTNVPWVAPCVYIQDYPRFSWRGVMLDVARHFIDKQGVKQILDAMAMHKLNTFHWHLVDDQGWRLQITNYPNLTSIGAWRADTDYGLSERASPATITPGTLYGGYYTQADAAEIVAYAAQRHITVIPEIEMPCHSDAALSAYPGFSCGDSGYSMDYPAIQNLYGHDLYSLGTPGTMAMLEDVLTEVMGIFPSQYIHCGGDEVVQSTDTQWNSYNADMTNMEANGITPNNNSCGGGDPCQNCCSIVEYQNWFTTQIANYLHARGRTMMGWTEIENDGVVPNTACMDWLGTQATTVAEAGQPVVNCPDTSCYINYVEGTGSSALPYEPGFAVGGTPSYLSVKQVYSFNPVPSGLPSQYTSNILGAQCNLWGEYVPSLRNVMFKMFPRETALAETTWTPQAETNYTSFTSRLVVEEQRYNAMGLNFDREIIPQIGSWGPTVTQSNTYTTLSFNITSNVTAAGEIDISFWYNSGSNLSITNVALLVNGSQVDHDAHTGTAESYSSYVASEPFIPVFHVYVLHLPELVPGATYTVQAQVAGIGGTSSSGYVYMPNWN